MKHVFIKQIHTHMAAVIPFACLSEPNDSREEEEMKTKQNEFSSAGPMRKHVLLTFNISVFFRFR